MEPLHSSLPTWLDLADLKWSASPTGHLLAKHGDKLTYYRHLPPNLAIIVLDYGSRVIFGRLLCGFELRKLDTSENAF